MAVKFKWSPVPAGVKFHLVEKRFVGTRVMPLSEWVTAPYELQPAIRYLKRLLDGGDAVQSEDAVTVSSGSLAQLPGTIAGSLGLPPVAAVALTLGFVGRVDSPQGHIRTSWQDPNARQVNPVISGIFVEADGRAGRLSGALYDLLTSVALYNSTEGQPFESRVGAWQKVQEALARSTGVTTDGYLGSLTIFQAGAFSLDVRETPAGPDFVPILMARSQLVEPDDGTDAPEVQEDGVPVATGDASSDGDPQPLLPPELQQAFTSNGFAGPSRIADAHVLARNTFVLLDPELRTALDLVKAVRAGTPEQRREFLRNPRSVLVQTLGDGNGTLFIETKQYSDRVNGLGIWEKPSIPWLTRRSSQWLPESFPLKIGDKTLEMTPQRVEELEEAVEDADREKRSSVNFDNQEFPIADVKTALSTLPPRPRDVGEETEGESEDRPAPDNNVLLIKTNVDGVEYELARAARRSPMSDSMPLELIRETVPEPHQSEGFAWLVQSWRAGWPGVLLADDMGLGKTFQTLAFLAWVRAGQRKASSPSEPRQGPILIVAPTALLRNWVAESEARLAPNALGERAEAFGSGLQRLKTRKDSTWTPETALDVGALRSAGWVLTTYETLAAYHRAFARIGYSVAVFDEIQKAKSPDTINTHAAKAINADFVVGLSGTPIENRLEDLWCIMDRIAPGYLGDLKTFSGTYGAEDPVALTNLKVKLDQWQGSTPPVMLRRMKEAIRSGLPRKEIKTYRVEMPASQAAAYRGAVIFARAGKSSPKDMLRTIHMLRGISLHPFGHDIADPYDPAWRSQWISSSARLAETFRILRELDRSGEKALVFIEDLAIQKAFAVAISAALNLERDPAIINGGVEGSKRQLIVDRFQAAKPGFDLLVLSPRAAGLGLTITAANHVIHLSRWWNPAIEDQCNDRIYRIGQTKPVTIHIPLAVHPEYGEASFDIKLDQLLSRKRALSREMLAPPVGDRDVGTLFEETVQ